MQPEKAAATFAAASRTSRGGGSDWVWKLPNQQRRFTSLVGHLPFVFPLSSREVFVVVFLAMAPVGFGSAKLSMAVFFPRVRRITKRSKARSLR